MKPSRLFLTFALALTMAAAASILVFKKLKQSAVKAATATYQVVAVAKDLELGAKLSEGDLKQVDWVGSRPQGTISQASEAVGRAVLYPLFRDELLLEAKLAPAGAGAGLAAVIPEGMRAVSIRVDEVVAVAGFVGPGTRVDVLLTGDPTRSRGGGDDSLTKMILENVQVLAAGQKIQPDAQGKPEKVNVVTLLCSPDDAAKVTLAASEGRIQLVLRNPTDKAKTTRQPLVVRRTLYQGGAPAEPRPVKKAVARAEPPPPPPAAPAPPPPPTMAVVEIIRAQTVSKVDLPVTSAEPTKQE